MDTAKYSDPIWLASVMRVDKYKELREFAKLVIEELDKETHFTFVYNEGNTSLSLPAWDIAGVGRIVFDSELCMVDVQNAHVSKGGRYLRFKYCDLEFEPRQIAEAIKEAYDEWWSHVCNRPNKT